MGAFQFATYHPLIGYSVGCRNTEYCLRFFVIRTLMGATALATPVRALSRSYNSTRARNRMPFVCALPASPPLFLTIRTLIESEPQFMPMLCAAFSCAVSALARTQVHQSVCLIYDTSYAFIQQKRSGVIAGSCCSCCDW